VAGALRLFVAVDPPEPVRRHALALRRRLERAAGRAAGEVKWVAPENLHLTLQFLGAVPEERLDEVSAAVTGAAAPGAPLELALQGAGAFPGARRARVLWAGVAGEVPRLGALVAELGRRLAPLGYPPEERAFSPHLTLGRARDPRGLPGLAAALAAPDEAPATPWPVTELVLYRSHLSPRGPSYQPLLRAPLQRSGP
jgi:RNA 2',3'-cyclic 3'-phosphodiesterase